MAGTLDVASAGRSGGFFDTLREALAAAGREAPSDSVTDSNPTLKITTPARACGSASPGAMPAGPDRGTEPLPASISPSAAEAARIARASAPPGADRHVDADTPPTTHVVRGPLVRIPDGEPRTTLLRGKQTVARESFQQDPVVGWLVVVGGPGLGSYRPIHEGNNALGRASSQRIPIDFGDDSISAEEQAFIRYDSMDRSFLFVPNLAKANVVQVNDRKPTAAVALEAMDVITMGRTQLVFVPFCGSQFDWSELTEAKT